MSKIKDAYHDEICLLGDIADAAEQRDFERVIEGRRELAALAAERPHLQSKLARVDRIIRAGLNWINGRTPQ